MPTVSQSGLTFDSGGKPIRLDAYIPAANGNPLPAVVALHGAGGDVQGMDQSAMLLAEQGFAVYVLHYFDRTDTESADKATILRHFPIWMKTLWDAVSAYLSLANSSIDNRVQAVVEFFGGLPREMKLFMRRLCPVLILHGEADSTIPVSEAYNLQRLLEEKVIPYEIKIYPGTGHGFENDVWRDAGPRTLRFLKKHLAAPQK